jgi:hypothetical protein
MLKEPRIPTTTPYPLQPLNKDAIISPPSDILGDDRADMAVMSWSSYNNGTKRRVSFFDDSWGCLSSEECLSKSDCYDKAKSILIHKLQIVLERILSSIQIFETFLYLKLDIFPEYKEILSILKSRVEKLGLKNVAVGESTFMLLIETESHEHLKVVLKELLSVDDL